MARTLLFLPCADLTLRFLYQIATSGSISKWIRLPEAAPDTPEVALPDRPNEFCSLDF